MARIAITDPLPPAALDYLAKRGHEAVVCATDAPELASAEAWLVRSGTHIGEAALARANTLRAIGRAGVGVDNIDVAAATARGIAVFHAPTGNITSAAEQAWALLLAAARHVPAADASMKQGHWARKELKGTELADKTMFIIGFGRIGRMMASRAAAFEMRVLIYDPFVTAEQAEASGVSWVDLDEGVATADVITLHTPLTPQTRELIDAERLAKAKPGAILVNAARGGLVEPAALLAALEDGRIRAAGLDVWAEEPPTDWRLAKHPRVVAAPHLGASTEEAQLKAAMQACARVCDFLDSGDAGLAINAQVRVPAPLRPWVELAEELAGFALQLVDGTIEEILVASDPALDPEALRVHALVGALRVGSESAVNAINAPAMAAERGWAVASKRLPDANPPYVRLEVRSTQGHVLIEGTHTPHYGGRVTRIDGFDVEFRPRGRFLVTHHDDVPGVLAAITRVLADADVNVAGVSLARERARGDALAVIEVDGSIPKQARDALRMVAHIRVAHRVRVGV